MSRISDVDDLLARSRPARLEPPRADPGTLAAILADRATVPAPVRRRSRRALLVTAGATAAVVTAVAAGIAITPEQQKARPATPDANSMLLAAAEHTTTAASGRYLHLRSEYGFAVPVTGAGGTYTVLQRTTGEYWLARPGAGRSWVLNQSIGVKPAGPDDEAAWRRAGSPTVVRVTRPKPAELSTRPGKLLGNPVDQRQIFGIGDRTVSVADLAKLPAEPGALRAALLARFDGGGGDMPTDRGQWLIGVTATLLVDLPVSGAVRAAAFRLLAGLPGVRGLGPVRDGRGRAGQAVTFVQNSPGIGRFEVRLIIDPDRGTALGRESRAVRPLGPWSWLKPGELATYQLVLADTYTDQDPPRVDGDD